MKSKVDLLQSQQIRLRALAVLTALVALSAAIAFAERANAYPLFVQNAGNMTGSALHIDSGTGVISQTIALPSGTLVRGAPTIASNGLHAWIPDRMNGGGSGNNINPLDLAGSGSAEPLIYDNCGGSDCGPIALALSENGLRLFAINAGNASLSVYDAVSGTFVKRILLPLTGAYSDVVVTPDGQTALVANSSSNSVVVQSIDADTPSVTNVSGMGTNYGHVVLDPGGQRAYFGSQADRRAAAVDVASGSQIGVPISVGSPGDAVKAIATSFTGSQVYIGLEGAGGDQDRVQTIDAGTGSVSSTQSIGVSSELEPTLSLLPKGDVIVASQQVSAGNNVFRLLRLSDGNVDTVAAPGSVGTDHNTYAWALPFQAPVAAYTVGSNANGTVAFDASGSNGVEATISEYRWDFGDGQTATTSSPQASHTYASAGNRTVTLRVIDSNDTSTSKVFDGRRVLRNGGSSAQTSSSVAVSAPPTPAPIARITPLTSANQVVRRATISDTVVSFATPTKACVPYGSADSQVTTAKLKLKKGKKRKQKATIKQVWFYVDAAVQAKDKRKPFKARLDVKLGLNSNHVAKAKVFYTLGKSKKQKSKTISRGFKICA